MPAFQSFTHPTAEVAPGATLGPGCRIWHHVHIMDGAVLGEGVVVGHACFIGPGVRVGSRSRIQNHVNLFEGVELEEDVFVGPSVTFTNVLNPRAEVSRKHEFRRTLVRRGATVGANATILPGVTLGEYCFVGAGAVVTRDVPAFVLVVGVPARPAGHRSRRGVALDFDGSNRAVCSESGEVYRLRDETVVLLSDVGEPGSDK